MNSANRIALARTSLTGVAVGDAFGERFFINASDIDQYIQLRKVPPAEWSFTDDTIMSIAVFEEMEQDGAINQERLIKKFCTNHDIDPNRGYGATLRRLIREIQEGGDWRKLSKASFDGQGSMGNGAAMRVCPIGAYHFDDIAAIKQNVIAATEVTHANHEAIQGAIAVAVATALAARMKLEGQEMSPVDFMEAVANELEDSETKAKINRARSVPYSFHIKTVTGILGNGTQMTCQDTVPFVTWCAAHHLLNFEEALWKAITALGDRDTICAMVGGITIMSTAAQHIPEEWLNSVEDIESGRFRNK